MKSFKQLTTVLLAVTFVWCSLSLVQAEKPKSKAITVPKILEVTHQLQKTNPPTLFLYVVGEVPTGGYTNVILERAVYVKPPEDGIQDYYLKAVPPSGVAITVISEVKASDVWIDLPVWVKGIRVHGEKHGIQTVQFDQEHEMEPIRRRFTGSYVGDSFNPASYEKALQKAIKKLNRAVSEGGVNDALTTWKVVKTSGHIESDADRNQINVTIEAERLPPWPKQKQSRKQKRHVKPVGKNESTLELKTSEQ